MKRLINKFHYNSIFNKIIFLIAIVLFLSNCATIETSKTVEPETFYKDKTYKIDGRLEELSKLQNIEMNGHIDITHPHKNANMFAKFKYNSIDSLKIQFKDLIGRKIALLDMNMDNYHLWLQRQDQRMEGNRLPDNYSYFTLDNRLSMSELRRILLGIPISEESKGTVADNNEIIKYSSTHGLKALYEVDNNHNYIKKVSFYNRDNLVGKVIYKEYKYSGNFLLPSQIIIENIQNPIKIEIKLSHFKFDTLAVL